jgi:hypothetical protein
MRGNNSQSSSEEETWERERALTFPNERTKTIQNEKRSEESDESTVLSSTTTENQYKEQCDPNCSE